MVRNVVVYAFHHGARVRAVARSLLTRLLARRPRRVMRGALRLLARWT